MLARCEPHPVGVPGRERYPGDPTAPLRDNARARLQLRLDVAAHRALAFGVTDLARRRRGYERVAVDLSVRMVDRCAHFAAAILEHEDILDLRTGEQYLRAIGPEVHDLADLLDAEAGERLAVLR